MVVAVSCVLLLSVISVTESLTPGAVVAAFALLPLAAGMWTLSGRFATVVLGATVLLFVGAALIETESRMTLSLVALPILAVGVRARLSPPGVPGPPVAPAAPPADERQPLASLTRRELEVDRLAARANTAGGRGQTSRPGRAGGGGERTH